MPAGTAMNVCALGSSTVTCPSVWARSASSAGVAEEEE